ncbi:hypothetical protein [Kutzneria chonburiensis]|uniref:DUF1707 domain-containing protein n=1 Tax=Kutzneria chonburiensis TaxID=1483604 RepID=A0ABV6MND7_9PSEU|nr:hypothetical protein [Kutzneria chonburiensis]
MTNDDVDRFFTLFAKRQKENEESGDGPRLADGTSPRGLQPTGLVRTTGWLQIGSRPVSSAFLAALAAFPVAAALVAALMTTVPVVGLLIVLLPTLCYGGWRLLTIRVRPASAARDLGTAEVDDVAEGSWIRLHGAIGPVAQVASTSADESALVEVTFVGGGSRSWPSGHRLHLAEVLD